MRCRAVNSSIYFTSISELDGVMNWSDELKKNRVTVTLHTNQYCNAQDGGYILTLDNTLQPLNLDSVNGPDDISLIKECIATCLRELPTDIEIAIEIILTENGEWEGPGFHRCFTLVSAEVMS